MEEITLELLQSYQKLYHEYRASLIPNRKGAEALITYLQETYPTVEITNAEWKEMLRMELLENEFLVEKIMNKADIQVQVFEIQKQGKGNLLYELQEPIYKGTAIIVGIELSTGHLHIEGSSYLDDRLFLYRGLDEQDLENYYLVGRYITLLRANGEC